MYPPPRAQTVFGESTSPLGTSGHLHGESSLPPGPQMDRTRWVKPLLGCPTGQDGVTGTNRCSSVQICAPCSSGDAEIPPHTQPVPGAEFRPRLCNLKPWHACASPLRAA